MACLSLFRVIGCLVLIYDEPLTKTSPIDKIMIDLALGVTGSTLSFIYTFMIPYYKRAYDFLCPYTAHLFIGCLIISFPSYGLDHDNLLVSQYIYTQLSVQYIIQNLVDFEGAFSNSKRIRTLSLIILFLVSQAYSTAHLLTNIDYADHGVIELVSSTVILMVCFSIVTFFNLFEMSERMRKSQEELIEQKLEYQSIIENFSEAILITQNSGNKV